MGESAGINRFEIENAEFNPAMDIQQMLENAAKKINVVLFIEFPKNRAYFTSGQSG